MHPALLAVALLAVGAAGPLGGGSAGVTAAPDPGIRRIEHVIVIMQENRSFDSYFGTYPGADGIPAGVCVADPAGGCQRPYHDPQDVNGGGPHGEQHATADVDGGKMDGFIAQAESGRRGCADPNNPACTNGRKVDVMGWHDAREIPNYWSYAQDYVLQDRMFEPNASWSLPEHLFQVSEWSAYCTRHDDPSSCTNALQSPGAPPDRGRRRNADGLRAGRATAADLRLDRSDVPAAQEQRQLGLLRRRRHRARLRERRRRLVRRAEAERQDARHLESAAVLRHRQSRRRTRQHPFRQRLLHGCEERNAPRRRVDRPLGRRERTPAGRAERGDRPTSPA